MKKGLFILLTVTILMATVDLVFSVYHECYVHTGKRVKYVVCSCNCYKYSNTIKGKCKRCLHYINKKLPQSFKPLT